MKHGLKVKMVPEEYVAESVVKGLRDKVNGKRVLLVRAKVARDVIPDELRAAGAQVDVVEAYETVVPEKSRTRLRASDEEHGTPSARRDLHQFIDRAEFRRTARLPRRFAKSGVQVRASRRRSQECSVCFDWPGDLGDAARIAIAGRDRSPGIHDGWIDSRDRARPLRRSLRAIDVTIAAATPASGSADSHLRIDRVQVRLHACPWLPGGIPVNSIPLPTPGSQVRTTAVMLMCSESSQKSTRNTVPSGQRHHALDVASISAHVGGVDAHRSLHALVAKFEGKRDLVPVPASPVEVRKRRASGILIGR